MNTNELDIAFQQTPHDEDRLAQLCGHAFETQTPGTYPYLLRFLDLFPESLHPIRAFLANALSGAGQFDAASNEARIYLRTLANSNALNSQEPMLQEGLARCILPATAVYTEAGARSYSLRILEWGLQRSQDPYWHDVYSREKMVLKEELQDSVKSELNQNWEDFFKQGDHLKKLHALCMEKGFKALAQRISILGTELNYNQNGMRAFEEEFLLVLFLDPKKELFTLA